jgi:hypothetical protein
MRILFPTKEDRTIPGGIHWAKRPRSPLRYRKKQTPMSPIPLMPPALAIPKVIAVIAKISVNVKMIKIPFINHATKTPVFKLGACVHSSRHFVFFSAYFLTGAGSASQDVQPSS